MIECVTSDILVIVFQKVERTSLVESVSTPVHQIPRSILAHLRLL